MRLRGRARRLRLRHLDAQRARVELLAAQRAHLLEVRFYAQAAHARHHGLIQRQQRVLVRQVLRLRLQRLARQLVRGHHHLVPLNHAARRGGGGADGRNLGLVAVQPLLQLRGLGPHLLHQPLGARALLLEHRHLRLQRGLALPETRLRLQLRLRLGLGVLLVRARRRLQLRAQRSHRQRPELALQLLPAHLRLGRAGWGWWLLRLLLLLLGRPRCTTP
mmetsp:Transcript_529/g.1412  ORF Transcript_529/g.1412 Transcript_529/m.1412 type:complete len:219 (+) Transcript_529:513-1169(+)